MTRLPPKKINGIVLLDKPLNMTSNQALQKVKRIFNAKKAGHTGSLDPLATGMLPICFGEATKFSQFLLESDKTYQVVAKLGVKTTTGDAEGSILETRPIPAFTREQIEGLLAKFLGPQQQIPPMFSAIKYQGKPLYELARMGIEIERKSRFINIHALQLTEMSPEFLHIFIHCSKGTYVRTLVEDIGELLGCGAHVSGLHRGAVMPYQHSKMYSLEALETLNAELGPEVLKECLLPLESSVDYLPQVKLSTSALFYIRMGQPIMAPQLPTNGFVRIYGTAGEFIGVGEIQEDGLLAPRRLVQAH
jgi:tRNA pseudouridine55 synthase